MHVYSGQMAYVIGSFGSRVCKYLSKLVEASLMSAEKGGLECQVMCGVCN